MFGGQTVTFITVTREGDPDDYGVAPEVHTPVEVSGCRFRPLDAAEAAASNVAIAEQVWKATCPPAAAAVAATSTGEVQVDGITYEIIGGAKPFPDMSGQVFKVTILCRRRPG